MNIHFIGIGGTGMSGLAKMCYEKGLNVTGSDQKLSEATKILTDLGIKLYIGHRSENVNEDLDVVVYSTAVKEDNVELCEARKFGIDIWHRSKVLSYLSTGKTTVGVAGAHGKTTSVTFLGEMFEKNNFRPSVAAGGKLVFENGNGKFVNDSDIFVAELDESDGSFLKIDVESAIITNIDDDHLDFYDSKENIEKAFVEFIDKISGVVVINGEDEILMKICKGRKNVITFGRSSVSKDFDYTIDSITVQNFRNTCKAYYRGTFIGNINIPLPGDHNLMNALGVLAMGRAKGLEDFKIFKTFETFQGVGRRFEVKGQVNGVTIVDDYAHHPKEIESLLYGAKSFGYKRVISVFQPHRYTRTNQLYDYFVSVLKDSDLCVITKIYDAGEPPIPGISGENLSRDIGDNSVYLEDFNTIVKFLKENIMPEDLVITIGAGNITEVGGMLLHELQK